MSATSSHPPRSAAPRALWVLTALVVTAGSLAACATPSSRIVLPPCSDEISVSGEHTRSGSTTLLLDHSMDFPFTRTDITLEQKGRTRHVEVVNSTPDWWRMAGGSLIGLGGAGLMTRYGYGVALGEDPLRSPWLWGLPCGALAFGVGGLMMSTGWHPSGDTVIEGRCVEPRPTQ